MPEQDAARLRVHRGLVARVDLLGAGIGALRGRSCRDGLEPALQVREIREVLLLALVRHDPGVAGHVGNGVVARDEFALGQLLVEHGVQARGFLDVARDGVRDFLGRVLAEVVVLPGHRAQAAHLPEQPLQRLVAATQVGGDEAATLVGQVQQDGAGLEQAQRRAAIDRGVVHDGRDAVVRCDLQEIGLELRALPDVHRHDPVRQLGLFQEHRDFVAVGGGPVVQVDHAGLRDGMNPMHAIIRETTRACESRSPCKASPSVSGTMPA